MAGGGISMSFRCVDSVGDAVVIVRLRGDGCKGPNDARGTKDEGRAFLNPV